MSNTYFQFKQFRIDQDQCAMKVCTDACIFGAWYATKLEAGEITGRAVKRILDIGSGTGLLMMMLAQKASASIDGIEIEPACYDQMKANLGQNNWSTRLTALHGDARTFRFAGKYDFIISNPPFYDNDLSSPLKSRQLAMHGDALNMRELLAVLVTNLAPSGTAGILLPSHRAQVFEANAVKEGLHKLEELSLMQTPKLKSFRTITTYGFAKPASIKTTKLVIKDSANAYTTEFKQLLAPYYLHLMDNNAPGKL